MIRQNILLVDDDHQSLRLMEVSLRKAGFVVQTARNGTEALDRVATTRPAMVIADTDMPGMDGFELCTRFKGDPRNAEIPFVFLTEEASVDAKVRGLELGADDYLTRPIFTRELLARVKLLLEKHKRRSLTGQHRFFGDLAEMSVVDLMQTIEIGGKSGRARFETEGGQRAGVIWFLDGAIADADAGGLTGEEAVFRLMNWDVGTFEMDFRAAPPRRAVDASIQALILEGMRRIDEWSRIEAQLPPLSTRFSVDQAELAEADIDAAAQTLLDRVDGRQAAEAIIAAAPLPDLTALQIMQRLYFEGVLIEAEGSIAPAAAAPPEDAEPEPVVQVQRTPAPRPTTPQRPTKRPTAPPAGSANDLVSNLIRSATNLPALSSEQTAAARQARADQLAPSRAPDPALAMTLAAPRRDTAPEVEAVAEAPPASSRRITLEPPQQAPPVVEPDAAPDAPDAPATAEDRDLLDAWASGSVSQGGDGEDDLFAEPERPVSRAALVAVGLLLVVIVAIVAFMMRDAVEPFQLPKKALNTGWHTTALQKRVAPTSVAAIEGDWTLPTREGGPAALAMAPPSAAPDSAEAPADPPEDPPEDAPDDAPTDAPASAAPKSAAPSVADAPAPIVDAPEPPAPAATGKFARLMKDGKAQFAKGRYAQAAGMLAQAVELEPKNADAHLAHADALLEAGKDDAALGAAQKAIQFRPSAAKAHLIIGTIYQMKGKKEAAIDAYDRFLKLAPAGRDSNEVRSILEGLR